MTPEARALWHIMCPICGEVREMRRRRGTKPHTCGSTWCVGINRYMKRYGRWPTEAWLAYFAVENGLLRLPKKLKRPASIDVPSGESLDGSAKAQEV